MLTATYSPEDNKLRLSASYRLDKPTYERLRAAGFVWAPKQGVFVAPAWTPAREDLLIELAGEIDDEDTTLEQRAEDRADRYDDYGANRTADAEAASKSVAAIADNIPFGQPVLVGHHSERRHRRDIKRMDNGMAKACRNWKLADRWKERAAAAIAHAKYKQRPDVRARRIRTLEADHRKRLRLLDEARATVARWNELIANPPADFHKRALDLASLSTNFDTYNALRERTITPADAAKATVESNTAYIALCERWIEHFDNRLTYERAMLAADGGIPADRTGPEVGGACRCWAAPPAGWAYIVRVNKVSVTILDNWGRGGANFTRTIPFDKLKALMTADLVRQARETGRLIETSDKTGFGLLPEPKTHET